MKLSPSVWVCILPACRTLSRAKAGGAEFTVGSYCALFNLLNRMQQVSACRSINAEMPILLISGKDDPCTGGEKGREQSRALLERAGFRNISVITYDHMRHEILNEADHEKVYRQLLDFLLGQQPGTVQR